MPFTRDDITADGPAFEPGTAGTRTFTVNAKGEAIGVVSVPSAFAIVNRGEDVQEWVAAQLSHLEEGHGRDRVLDRLAEGPVQLD
jgi:hypothetical protein